MHRVKKGQGLLKFEMWFSESCWLTETNILNFFHKIKTGQTKVSELKAFWKHKTGILKWKLVFHLTNTLRRAASTLDFSLFLSLIFLHVWPSLETFTSLLLIPSILIRSLNPNSNFLFLYSVLLFNPGTFAWTLKRIRKGNLQKKPV